ncbi:unnamed protein product [Thlaspi arvense]|uniref:Uncharacterized protein n=1 Tax=Thlaspi arvense TaxID=13288 RepID=A0AAU9SDC7_THLAR|nr:unnamed protein product [Thlaspi arvense]
MLPTFNILNTDQIHLEINKMAIRKSMKPMAQVLLLLPAIHLHKQTVGSTTESSALLAFLNHSSVTGNKPSSDEINFSVWRRELKTRGGGGGSRGGGGGGSSGSCGGGGSGGSGGSGTGGRSSGDYLKHCGLSNSQLFIGILVFLVVVC